MGSEPYFCGLCVFFKYYVHSLHAQSYKHFQAQRKAMLNKIKIKRKKKCSQITLSWKMIWLGQLRHFLFLNLESLFIRDLLPYSIPCTLYPSHGINKNNQKPVSKQEAQFYANNTQLYVFFKEKMYHFYRKCLLFCPRNDPIRIQQTRGC